MSALFHQFGVSWQLLGAQVVNFIILLFILKKFAYRPLLDMLNERRTRIAEGLRAAEASKKRLAEADAEKEAVLLRARKESLAVVQQSEKIAKEKGDEILAGVAKTAEGIVQEGKIRAAEEKVKMKEEVWRESTLFLKEALGRIVEKSPETLDEKLIHGVVQELKKI